MFFIIQDETRRNNAITALQGINLAAGEWSVEIKRYRRNRSSAQNRTYWMFLNTLAADIGHTAEELHELCKARFLGFEEFKVMGDVVRMPRSTTKLTVGEFADYMRKIEQLAATMNIRLPHPDDYRYAMEGR